MRKALSLTLTYVLLLTSVSFTVGCRHNVNTNNPQVVAINTLGDAMNTCKAVHDATQAADKTIDSLQTSEPDYYAHAQPIIKKIRDANDFAVRQIMAQAEGGNTDWKSAMLTLASTIKPGDLTTFGFKNPNTQAIVNTSIAGLEALLLTIPNKLNGGTQ